MGSPRAELQIKRLNKHARLKATSTDLVMMDPNQNAAGAAAAAADAERRRDDLLYKINSFECFNNLPYQRQCAESLFGRIFSADQESAPNSTELLRLLQALHIQAPGLQLPLPAGFIPLIRFDSEKVPYFEFHYFTPSLPLMPPLSGAESFLKTVDKTVLEYSAAILESMTEAHIWSLNGYPLSVNAAAVARDSNFGERVFENVITARYRSGNSRSETNFKAIEWTTKSSARNSKRVSTPLSKGHFSRAKKAKTNISAGKNKKGTSSRNRAETETSENIDELDENSENEFFNALDEENDDKFSSLSESDTNITRDASTSKKTIRKRKPVNKEFPSFSSKVSTGIKQGKKKSGASSVANQSTTSQNGKSSRRLSRESINCKKCNREFSRHFTYIRHVNDVHKKMKPFICQFITPNKGKCGYSCSQEYQAKKHVEKKHDVQAHHVDKYLLVKSNKLLTTSTSEKKRGRKPKTSLI